MEVNEVRVSTDKDFEHFHSLVNNDDGWTNSYNKNNLIVKTRWTDESRIKLIKVSSLLFIPIDQNNGVHLMNQWDNENPALRHQYIS